MNHNNFYTIHTQYAKVSHDNVDQNFRFGIKILLMLSSNLSNTPRTFTLIRIYWKRIDFDVLIVNFLWLWLSSWGTWIFRSIRYAVCCIRVFDFDSEYLMSAYYPLIVATRLQISQRSKNCNERFQLLLWTSIKIEPIEFQDYATKEILNPTGWLRWSGLQT